MIKPYLSRGNGALCKRILVWDMPHPFTCRGAGVCRTYCYQNKVVQRFKRVQRRRKLNLLFTMSQDFTEKMVLLLRVRPERIVRLHAAGDFYSQKYLDNWKLIAKANPNKIFWTFTKAFDLDLYSDLPSNLIIIQSYGSKFDEKIDPAKNTWRVIKSLAEKKPYEFVAPADMEWCGIDCKYCMKKENEPMHVVMVLK